MLHAHRFRIGDRDAIASLIEKLESAPRRRAAPRLGKAIRTAETRALEIAHFPRDCGERDLAFYHGLLTGYAVALRIAGEASGAAAVRRSGAPVVARRRPGSSIDESKRAAR